MSAGHISPILAVAAATVALLPSTQASAPASPAAAAPVKLAATGAWSLGTLPARARATFAADLRQVKAPARPVLALIDGSIAVDTDVAPCAGFGESCSFPAAAGSARPWRIHLASYLTAETFMSDRFIVYHEIGHAVWSMLLRPSDQQAFITAFNTGLHGARCRGFRTGRPCAPLQELFADEFARWAGGFAHSMTVYETPSAVPAAAMQAIVDGAVAAHA